MLFSGVLLCVSVRLCMCPSTGVFVTLCAPTFLHDKNLAVHTVACPSQSVVVIRVRVLFPRTTYLNLACAWARSLGVFDLFRVTFA